jgi:transcriptional regulator with XRE-family HTH domain
MILKGDALLKWRNQHQLSQVQAAEKIGVTQVYYYQLENEKRTPSLSVLQAIISATGLGLDELTTLANPTLPRPRQPGKRKEKVPA